MFGNQTFAIASFLYLRNLRYAIRSARFVRNPTADSVKRLSTLLSVYASLAVTTVAVEGIAINLFIVSRSSLSLHFVIGLYSFHSDESGLQSTSLSTWRSLVSIHFCRRRSICGPSKSSAVFSVRFMLRTVLCSGIYPILSLPLNGAVCFRSILLLRTHNITASTAGGTSQQTAVASTSVQLNTINPSSPEYTKDSKDGKSSFDDRNDAQRNEEV